jgi:hypothetical protein
MTLREITRKLLALAALLAMLATGMPGLAESLSAAEATCCNTVYCPVHHGQARQIQKDKTDCDAKVKLGQTECSMRACDPTPNPAVGTAPFVLIAPVTILYEAPVQAVSPLSSRFFPFVVSLPSTPPPRLLPS